MTTLSIKAKNIFILSQSEPRENQHIDFGLYFCARGYSHAHVRVAKSRARILYTNTRWGGGTEMGIKIFPQSMKYKAPVFEMHSSSYQNQFVLTSHSC